jgi:hypothetical protein
MIQKVAVIWDEPVLLTRLIEDCGHVCELITPHLLAAPFFRRKLHGLVIPAGFASTPHTSILASLRAVRARIKRYVEEGGILLVFGAGSDLHDPYDWLPVPISYRYGFAMTTIKIHTKHPLVSIIEENVNEVSVDGFLGAVPDGGERTAILEGTEGPIFIEIPWGNGLILVTSLHEYPSRCFVREFCARGGEGLL